MWSATAVREDFYDLMHAGKGIRLVMQNSKGFCDRWNKWEGQPRAPELNPVENIWQFMRDNWLSNRIFKTYDDGRSRCVAKPGTGFIDQPWKIMS